MLQLPTYDLHIHSNWSEDANQSSSIDLITKEAKDIGHTVIAITDHHYSNRFISIKSKIKAYRKECRAAEQKYSIRVLCGIEIDIEKDGSLQWSPSVLESLDLVIGAMHHHHKTYVTERLVEVISSGLIQIIAHPTNRIIDQRDESPIEWNAVFGACVKNGVALEINGSREDPPVDLIVKGKKAGVLFSIGSDAHCVNDLKKIDKSKGLALDAGLCYSDFFNIRSFKK